METAPRWLRAAASSLVLAGTSASSCTRGTTVRFTVAIDDPTMSACESRWGFVAR
jgi:hypothetical protein